LLKALGLTGIDKSKVSRICKELDQAVEKFRQSKLQESYPYVWLDALYLKARQNHRVVSLALVIAVGVDEQGERHLLGFDLGASEEQAFWLAFLRSLVKRGLKYVQLVISDAHEGLKRAINQIFAGASWQRCRVHFMRNLLARIPHRDKQAVADAVRLIFDQPNRQSAADQPSVIRLVSTLLMETDDDWRATQRKYFSLESMQLLTNSDKSHVLEPSSFLVDLTTTITAEA